MNPFGVPITEETLKQMPRYYGRSITQVDCAREAVRLIHAGGKNLDALKFAWDLKGSYGDGVSTLVLVYNATGGMVTLEDRIDWLGYVYNREPPRELHNGQWMAFLHVKPTAQALGSQAARVFRGRDVDGRTRDFVVAWSIPWGDTPTSAYTDIGNQNQFKNLWGVVKTNLERAKRITRAKDLNCASTVSIGGYTTSDCIAVIQHQFSPLPEEL